MVKSVLIALLAIVGIFLHPFNPGTLDFIFRFLIFSGIIYLVFENYKEKPVGNHPVVEKPEPVVPQQPETDIRQFETDLDTLLVQDQRLKEFLIDQFTVIMEMSVSANGWIFLSKNSDELVEIHRALSQDLNNEIEKIDIPLSGILQIVDSRNNTLLENNLKQAETALHYYSNADYQPESCLIVPVIVTETQKIFFAYDSAVAGHFNGNDLPLFSKIAADIEFVFSTRLRGLDLLQNREQLKSLLDLAQELNKSSNLGQAVDIMTEQISREFEATRLTLSLLRRDSRTAVIKKVLGQKDKFEENFEFSLDGGLNGWVIDKEKPYLIEDLEKGEYFIPRFSKEEKSTEGLHSFLGVPIISDKKVHGAITLEHYETSKFNEDDRKKLESLVKVFSNTFMRYAN